MLSSSPQLQPPPPVSVTVRAAPPATGTFFNWVEVERGVEREPPKAIHWPSGEKQEEPAPSVPGMSLASNSSSMRREIPAAPVLCAMREPSRERDGTALCADGKVKRVTGRG